MMSKSAFIEEVDNDNNDINFEHASHIHIVSVRDNQTHQSVMGCNIAGPLGEQGLLGA